MNISLDIISGISVGIELTSDSEADDETGETILSQYLIIDIVLIRIVIEF